jgi:YidC/Oxa1 family membrane protein insertase
MDRNFVIAMVLMVLVLFAWQAYFAPKPPEIDDVAATGETPAVSPTPTATPTATPTPAPMLTPPPEVMPPASSDALDAPIAPEGPTPTLAPAELATREFDNSLVKAVIENADAGGIRTWDLREFYQTPEDRKEPQADRDFVNMAPYNRPMVKKKVKPRDYADQRQLVCALSQMQGLDGKQPWQVTDAGPDHWTLQQKSGALTVTKTLRFRPRGATPQELPYNIDVEMEIANASAQVATVQPFCAVYEQIVEDTSSFFYRDYNQPLQASYIEGSLEAKHISKTEPDDVPLGPTYWTGFADNYFASLVGPDQETFPVQNARAKISILEGGIMEARLIAEPLNVPAGESKTLVFKAYLGPKKRDFIAAGNNGPKYHFDKSIDFGWFDIIARYLMIALIFIAGLTGNYGVAIIVVTVVIKFFMFPLQHKSFKSMRAMSSLQPEIAKLKEQYKDDREKMNQEMMALYRVHNVNPAGGCLPMLVQLPIFIAFYRALGYSIELRHTPFLFWLQDLSAQDPYYITPLLMGASMFLSQKLTPTSADPSQQRIMMMMPLIFTFMFLSFPSGLVLYWLTNNILSVAQQVITNKYFFKDTLPVPAKAIAGGNKKND